MHHNSEKLYLKRSIRREVRTAPALTPFGDHEIGADKTKGCRSDYELVDQGDQLEMWAERRKTDRF